MNSDDHEYFRRRARAEDKAAQRASCEVARERHTELAALYRDRFGKSAARGALQISVNQTATAPSASNRATVDA